MRNPRVTDNLSDPISAATTTAAADQSNDAQRDPRIEVLRLLDADLTDVCWRIITGYSPNQTSSAWSAVRSFVIECVTAMKPRTAVNTRRIMTMTALYVSWVWSATGCTLTAERVFTDALVARYLGGRLRKFSASYRFDTVRQLAAISHTLTGTVITRLPTPSQAGRVKPYTTNQIATLFAWANTLTTELKRQNARAFLALGAGAGLTAQELMAAQVEDITFTHTDSSAAGPGAISGNGTGAVLGAVVAVRGPRPRRVPVRANWVKTLHASVGRRTSGDVFHAYRLEEYPPHQLQQFITDHPCTPRPSAGRLHSGWIVTQLDAGLPIRVLLEITGFVTAQSLIPYLGYTQRQPVENYTARITGTSTGTGTGTGTGAA
ncbi:MAG: hypothetical protein H7288_22625 [Kineosporiaceae bacterium]|nr:hypothetical protein [Aeromicrobium sp.]